jgi:hypothetical protein
VAKARPIASWSAARTLAQKAPHRYQRRVEGDRGERLGGEPDGAGVVERSEDGHARAEVTEHLPEAGDVEAGGVPVAVRGHGGRSLRRTGVPAHPATRHGPEQGVVGRPGGGLLRPGRHAVRDLLAER